MKQSQGAGRRMEVYTRQEQVEKWRPAGGPPVIYPGWRARLCEPPRQLTVSLGQLPEFRSSC